MRDFARENNIDFWEGKGVCHQIMMENYVCPGELIFGADSHTCTYGALGAFWYRRRMYRPALRYGNRNLLGISSGDRKIQPDRQAAEGVYLRDLMLTIIGQIGANGVNYQVMEFTGDGAKPCVNDRMVLCNLAVEAGAKTAIFEADEIALEYLKARGREPKAVFKSDADAVYAREYTFDLSKIQPVAARPDFVDDVVPAKEVCGVRIDEAFLGSLQQRPYR